MSQPYIWLSVCHFVLGFYASVLRVLLVNTLLPHGCHNSLLPCVCLLQLLLMRMMMTRMLALRLKEPAVASHCQSCALRLEHITTQLLHPPNLLLVIMACQLTLTEASTPLPPSSLQYPLLSSQCFHHLLL